MCHLHIILLEWFHDQRTRLPTTSRLSRWNQVDVACETQIEFVWFGTFGKNRIECCLYPSLAIYIKMVFACMSAAASQPVCLPKARDGTCSSYHIPVRRCFSFLPFLLLLSNQWAGMDFCINYLLNLSRSVSRALYHRIGPFKPQSNRLTMTNRMDGTHQTRLMDGDIGRIEPHSTQDNSVYELCWFCRLPPAGSLASASTKKQNTRNGKC